MKVIHILTSDSGGAATGAIRQHYSLLDIGVDSTILCLNKSTNFIKAISYFQNSYQKSLLVRTIEKIGFKLTNSDIERLKINKLGKPFVEGGTFELFSSPYSNHDINNHPLFKEADIINLHWTSGFLDIPSFLTTNKKPVVWTLHDMYPYLGGFHYDIDLQNNPNFNQLEDCYKSVKINALRNTKYAVVGNSKWNTNKATESSVFRNAISFSTVYYPLLESDFFPIEKSIAKNALNIPSNKFVVGFACENLNNPRKGYNYLLESLEKLPESIKVNLICLNFGGVSTDQKRSQSLQTIEMGSISNPRLQSIMYSAMDLFIIPSLAEAFGLTALEAMACKTPVLGNNVGGIPEMIENDVTGFLFESSLPDSLLINLSKVISLDKEKRKVISENGFDNIIRQHNQYKVALEYENLYKELFNE